MMTTTPPPGPTETVLSHAPTRRALYAAGAAVAGAYFGMACPEGLNAMFSVLQDSAAGNPFVDPVAQADALFDGAKYHAASALHTAAEWFDGAGVEMTRQLRDVVNEGRAFIGAGLDQAKSFFCDQADSIGGAAATLRDAVRNATFFSDATVDTIWEVGKSAFEVLKYGAEAWGFYEAGKAAYREILGKGKDEVAEQTPDETEARTINLNVNIGLAGQPAADEASRQVAEGVADAVEGLDEIPSDQVIWMSEKMRNRLSDELEASFAAPGEIPDADAEAGETSRPARTSDRAVSDASRANFPEIHWDASPRSEARLAEMRRSSGIIGVARGARFETDLSGPDADRGPRRDAIGTTVTGDTPIIN